MLFRVYAGLCSSGLYCPSTFLKLPAPPRAVLLDNFCVQRQAFVSKFVFFGMQKLANNTLPKLIVDGCVGLCLEWFSFKVGAN